MAREDIPTQAPRKPQPSRLGWKNWVALGVSLAAMSAWQAYSSNRDAYPAISYTAFYALVTDAKIETLTIRGQTAKGRLKAPETGEGYAGSNFRTTLPAAPEADLVPSLPNQGAKVVARGAQQS